MQKIISKVKGQPLLQKEPSLKSAHNTTYFSLFLLWILGFLSPFLCILSPSTPGQFPFLFLLETLSLFSFSVSSIFLWYRALGFPLLCSFSLFSHLSLRCSYTEFCNEAIHFKSYMINVFLFLCITEQVIRCLTTVFQNNT